MQHGSWDVKAEKWRWQEQLRIWAEALDCTPRATTPASAGDAEEAVVAEAALSWSRLVAAAVGERCQNPTNQPSQ